MKKASLTLGQPYDDQTIVFYTDVTHIWITPKRDISTQPITWAAAVKACAEFGDGWQLPTVTEMEKLFTFSKKTNHQLKYSFRRGAYQTCTSYWLLESHIPCEQIAEAFDFRDRILPEEICRWILWFFWNRENRIGEKITSCLANVRPIKKIPLEERL